MSGHLRVLVVFTLLLVAALVAAGYVLGRHHGADWGVEALRRETAGVLVLQVETLARLHAGESESAINLLDASVDAAVTSLSGGSTTDELDPQARHALALAKVLRDRFPASGERAEAVRSALVDVPEPDSGSLSPGLRNLLNADPEDPFGGLFALPVSQP